MLSVVIPALNAATTLPAALAALDGAADEVIVADAGSTDGTVALARRLGARVVILQGGHGARLAAGCAAATGDWLLLLRADTRLAIGWEAAAARVMAGSPHRAAYFRFALEAGEPRARRLERFLAWRSTRFGLPAAEQGLLISRALLDDVGGVRPMPVLTELDLARRLGRQRLAGLPVLATTSAVTWRRDGSWRRGIRELGCLAMHCLRLPPATIARLHG
jgi:glycosyltransferase involved in cell wall biosynthesis